MKTESSQSPSLELEEQLRAATAKALAAEKTARAEKERARSAKRAYKQARKTFKLAKKAAKKALKRAGRAQEELKAWVDRAAKQRQRTRIPARGGKRVAAPVQLTSPLASKPKKNLISKTQTATATNLQATTTTGAAERPLPEQNGSSSTTGGA